ncbi:MAG: hypothetical protein WAW86_08470 [Gammaproteobacteria bacterium]
MAARREPTGLGLVAKNMMEPVGLFGDMINTACWLLGGAFLLISIIKYKQHRTNPTMVPISTVVFLIVAGAILVSLPLLATLTDSGVQYR